jgi:hypothetical protein
MGSSDSLYELSSGTLLFIGAGTASTGIDVNRIGGLRLEVLFATTVRCVEVSVCNNSEQV